MPMPSPRTARPPPAGSFAIVPAEVAARLSPSPPERLLFQVPSHWRSSIARNPFAPEAQGRVLEWLAALGCTAEELERVGAFDTAGYVGIPFPTASREKTVLHAKYLALWLLWDDMHVESRESGWKITAEHVLGGFPPPEMSRFDEGWWRLFETFTATRSPRWIRDLCEAMTTWDEAAAEDAELIQRYRETGAPPDFARQLDLRSETIGMYATLYLLEDAHGTELSQELHQHPVMRWLKRLANVLVGLGNDILGFAKDHVHQHPNLVSTLMEERGLPVEEALRTLIRMHDETLLEFDLLAESLERRFPEDRPHLRRWLQDVRYASLGFSLWEAQAPRYNAYKVVVGGRVLQPAFSFAAASRPEAVPSLQDSEFAPD